MVRLLSLAVLFTLVAPTLAQAHYLWLNVVSEKEDRRVDLVFEEGPYAGDGFYLDPIIERGTTWIQKHGSEEVTELKLKETKKENGKKGLRWLVGSLPKTDDYVVESYAKWGVYQYGKNFALLHYYAKHDTSKAANVAMAKKLDLDIQVTTKGNMATAKVTWKGKPIASPRLLIRGPQRFKIDGPTDKNGEVSFPIKDSGFYMFRAGIINSDEAGEFDGKTYDQVRHSATLSTNLTKAE